jgi:deferrochelatase/peroxidase EfeB
MGTILKLDDIQGNILRGYRSLHQARFMFFHTRSAVSGRRYIDALLPVVTTAKIGGEPGAATNIAFTFAGLRALGLPTSSLVSFPSAFQDGMKARAPLLGDSDESAPERWDAPWRSEPVHVMLMVYAASRMELEQSCRKVVQLAPDGVEELRPHQDAEAIFADGGGSLRIEHFGFAEGLSNPDLDNPPTEARQCPVGNSDGAFSGKADTGFPKENATGIESRALSDTGLCDFQVNLNGKRSGRAVRPVALGEFILGYPDEGGELGGMPVPHAFSRNGTYLVVRKLHQHVARFRAFIELQTTRLRRVVPGADPTYLAAKMIGRWPDGTPLAQIGSGAVTGRMTNEFGYADDPEGALCPLGAHIRRANPRDSLGFDGRLVNRHRLIRRGITYGTSLPPGSPDDHVPRGLLFLAFNADIERQFEFILRQWINDGDKFRQGNDRDPIVGSHDSAGRMVIPGDEREGRPPFFCSGIPRFVATKGGDYFFSPSLTGLRLMASDWVHTA